MTGNETVLQYLTSVPAWYLATSVDDQPHVRPFSFAAEQDGKLFAERTGVNVAAGERSQRRALADDDHILVDVADERRRQAVQTAVGRRSLHPAVVHADFKQLTCAQNRVRAKGLAVAENAALDFEPPKRVRAQLKTPGNDASRRAACVFLGGDIG